MLKDDLLKYVRVELGKGVSKDTIHSVLLAAGWKKEDIDTAFSKIESSGTTDFSNANYVTIEEESSKKTLLWLFLVLLVVVIGLVVWAYILGGEV